MSTPDTSDREEHEKLPEKPHQMVPWLAGLAGKRSETEDSWNLIFKRIALSCAPVTVPIIIICCFATVVVYLKFDLVRWLSVLAAFCGISGTAILTSVVRRFLGRGGTETEPTATGSDGDHKQEDGVDEDGSEG